MQHTGTCFLEERIGIFCEGEMYPRFYFNAEEDVSHVEFSVSFIRASYSNYGGCSNISRFAQ